MLCGDLCCTFLLSVYQREVVFRVYVEMHHDIQIPNGARCSEALGEIREGSESLGVPVGGRV